MTQLLEDKRPIIALIDHHAGLNGPAVGAGGVTEIICYGEPGLHCDQPYFAVMQGEHISQRVPAGRWTVVYADTTPQED